MTVTHLDSVLRVLQVLPQELVQMLKPGSKGDFKEGQPLVSTELNCVMYFPFNPSGGREAS